MVEETFCAKCPVVSAGQRQDELRAELEARLAELEQRLAETESERDAARKEASELRSKLGRLQRRRKRQAAPFSKGDPKPDPKKPGRKPGAAYGRKGHRAKPEKVDEVLTARLPDACPRCRGEIDEERVAPQYQVDIPPAVQPLVRQFDVHVGRCSSCQLRVQGRHPLQTSDALGAAASQIGPRALALVADWKVRFGLSYEMLSELLATQWQIAVTPGGLSQALTRLARAAEPTYEALRQVVQRADVVSPDETGWRVGGRSAWLWTFVTATVTFYAIEAGRGFQQAAKVLGESFSGIIVRDGWAPYRRFEKATHQTCLNHILRRCRKNLETALRGTARLPRAIRRILKAALELRDHRDTGRLDANRVARKLGALRAQMHRFLAWKPADDENRKLVKHLNNERDALFTFLEHPGLPATNHLAEKAIRPAIRVRKNCGGGNRTWAGARTTAVIATLLRTARQQRLDPVGVMVGILRERHPAIAAKLLPRTRAPAPEPPHERLP